MKQFRFRGTVVLLDNELWCVKDENGIIQDAGELLSGIDILTENNVPGSFELIEGDEIEVIVKRK
ncbi:hypothetical protein P9D80_01095 [Bacillus spizizenii]|uniref:hypothetical protein n=1 Tax=Bacillus spizizenii TaxID=96241 RepID=UPI002DB7FF48|nr:hypothetical protein [Bacillus spizizenii]MEC1583955.1 hypothetical protein [Bacillus spizizenii]